MECLSPIRVPNQSRFLVNGNRDRLYYDVRCGKCANCQQSKSAEWFFRAYHQYKHCVEHGGYVLFDTLTYSPACVPTLRQLGEFADLPSYMDYMCFSSRDIQLFNKRLRKRLRMLGYPNNCYSFFLSSEYGTSAGCTHRPHYHVLFYVYSPIDVIKFSRAVAQAWWYGRTDGVPYKPASYVRSNMFRSMSVGGRRVCNYVTKYVQKSSKYMNEVNKRIDHVVWYLSKGNVDIIRSPRMKEIRRKLARMVNQFHRQSIGFGASALDGVDEYELFHRGFFLMPNGQSSAMSRVPISNYFLRKIAYTVDVLPDGYKTWSVRSDKKQLIELRKIAIQRNLSNSMRSLAVGHDYDYDYDALSDYVINKQGRLLGVFNDVLTLQERYKYASLYVYRSIADYNHYNMRFVSDKYYGYKDNYHPVDGHIVSAKQFYDDNAYQDSHYEQQLSMLYHHKHSDDYIQSRQSVYDVKQRISNVVKQFSLS